MEKTCQESSLTEVLDTPPEMGEANGNGTDEDGSIVCQIPHQTKYLI